MCRRSPCPYLPVSVMVLKLEGKSGPYLQSVLQRSLVVLSVVTVSLSLKGKCVINLYLCNKNVKFIENVKMTFFFKYFHFIFNSLQG